MAPARGIRAPPGTCSSLLSNLSQKTLPHDISLNQFYNWNQGSIVDMDDGDAVMSYFLWPLLT